MNNGKMLVLNDLSVWYTLGKPVLEKLSMELGTNEVIGLLGGRENRFYSVTGNLRKNGML